MVESKKASDYVFRILNTLFLSLLTLACLYPCLYVLFASFSDPVQLYIGSKILLWPRGFSPNAFVLVFRNPNIWRAYLNTLLYVVSGTAIGLLLSILGAFVLSRKTFPGQKFFMTMVIITMFFGGGLIATYIVMRAYGLVNTIWSQILIGSMSTYNMIMVMSYFRSIPDSLEESAELDGASEWTILWKIFVPLSIPVIAVVALYFIVAKWNNWMTSAIYLTNREYYSLQLFLKEVLISGNEQAAGMNPSVSGGAADYQAYSEAVKYATIVVSTLPVLCVYPFLQKYFMKGVMLGAIKG